MMEFSKTLKNLRESREITQDELAKRLKVSRPTIAGYETKHRQPDFDKLLTLSEFFEVSVDYLLTGENAPEAYASNIPTMSEKSLDRKVVSSYKKLQLDHKNDVLEYIQLLELKEKRPKK